MMRVSCMVLLTLFVPNFVFAQGSEAPSQALRLSDIFSAANVAASRGDHAAAISRYQQLTRVGVRDPDVYFNLGTSLAQSGDYPRAILNYERVLALRPSDPRASDNLRDAERELEERRAEAEGEASIQRSSSIGDALYYPFTEDGLAYTLLVANVFFFALLAWVWVRRRRGRWLLAMLVLSAFLLVFSAFGLAVKSGMFRDGPRAIVLVDRVELREGPDPRAGVRGEARGGDRGEIIDIDRDFVKFRVIGGLEGWAPTTAVGRIEPNDATH